MRNQPKSIKKPAKSSEKHEIKRHFVEGVCKTSVLLGASSMRTVGTARISPHVDSPYKMN